MDVDGTPAEKERVVEKLLIVEDEEVIRAGLAETLAFHGYHVTVAGSGTEADALVAKKRFDLIILDLMLPGKDGFTLCAEWRKAGRMVPILMLTARGEEEHRVKGLTLGADDYVTKPFSLKELVARVRAFLRRAAPDKYPAGKLAFAGGTVNPDRLEYVRGTATTPLTELDLRSLRLLALNPGRVLSRAELLEKIWDVNGDEMETRMVDMQIAKLRRKLFPDGNGEQVITTVRSGGYMYQSGDPA